MKNGDWLRRPKPMDIQINVIHLTGARAALAVTIFHLTKWFTTS
jgi:hypothetical protein